MRRAIIDDFEIICLDRQSGQRFDRQRAIFKVNVVISLRLLRIFEGDRVSAGFLAFLTDQRIGDLIFANRSLDVSFQFGLVFAVDLLFAHRSDGHVLRLDRHLVAVLRSLIVFLLGLDIDHIRPDCTVRIPLDIREFGRIRRPVLLVQAVENLSVRIVRRCSNLVRRAIIDDFEIICADRQGHTSALHDKVHISAVVIIAAGVRDAVGVIAAGARAAVGVIAAGARAAVGVIAAGARAIVGIIAAGARTAVGIIAAGAHVDYVNAAFVAAVFHGNTVGADDHDEHCHDDHHAE